jgi:leader peptidase (prepilin peptidase)/N-methyltransferase
VELLTGLLFAAITWRFWQNAPTCIALLLFTAVMVAVYFIDLDTFTIPDSLNILAFLIPLARDGWAFVQKEAGYTLLYGWLPPSLLGAFVGVLALGFVRVAGWVWKRQEAMGLGDVLLARGMGAMLVFNVAAGANPLRHFLVWVLLACISGAIVGPLMIWWRVRNAPPEPEGVEDEEEEPPLESDSTFGAQVMAIGYCLLLFDIWEYLYDALQRLKTSKNSPTIEKSRQNSEETPSLAANIELEFTPAPTAIPFGPFLVLGFLATLFIGEWCVKAYLNYAFPTGGLGG